MRLVCRLREYRGERSLTVMQEATGIHRGTLSRIERGFQFATEKQIPPLEAAYGYPVRAWYEEPDVIAVRVVRDL